MNGARGVSIVAQPKTEAISSAQELPYMPLSVTRLAAMLIAASLTSLLAQESDTPVTAVPRLVLRFIKTYPY